MAENIESYVPVLVFTSLYVTGDDVFTLHPGDCILLDTAGYREKLRYCHLAHAEDGATEPYKLVCRELD